MVWINLTIKKEVKDKLMCDCVEEYLSHHPEMEGKNITQNHILRSEEHTSELQSHSFISYAVFCLKKKKTYNK